MARSSQNSNSGARKGKRPGLVPTARKRRPQLPPEEIDWKNFPSLRRFLSERGKIRSRRITGLSRRQQSELARAVKRARTMGLFPYPDQERNLREKTLGGASTTSTRTAPAAEHTDHVEHVDQVDHVDAVENIEGVEVVSED
jgi:small subunit ribosomal protein S18